MTRSKISLFVVLLLIVFAFIFFLAYIVNSVSSSAGIKASAAQEQELVASLADKEYMIYYVGTPSQHLLDSGMKMTVVPEAEMSSDTLPVYGYSFNFVEYDADNNVVRTENKVEYAYYLLVYVDDTVTLDADKAELLRNCAVDNDVPVIIEGKANINMFRSALLLSEHIYQDQDTMIFTPWAGAQDHVIPTESLDDGPLLVGSLMAQMNTIINDKDEYTLESRAAYVESASESMELESSEEAEASEPLGSDAEETSGSDDMEIVYDGTFAEGYDEP